MKNLSFKGWIGMSILCSACVSTVTEACAPLPELIYPADDVYRSKGLVIPELPTNAVALLDGELALKADYQDFLYRKIGFDPSLRRDFVLNRSLKKHLESAGIDTVRERQRIVDHFSLFDARGIITSCDDWIAMNEKKNDLAFPPRSTDAGRVEASYLKALYVLENWEVIYSLGLEKFGVAYDCLTIEGDDPDLQHLIQLNNALEIQGQFYSLIEPHIMTTCLAGEDLNLPGGADEFRAWLYAYHDTVFLLETYLGMLLSYQSAEELNLQISEETIREEFKSRVETYQTQLQYRRKKLPATCIPLELSEIYTDFIMQEIRDDLYKSKAHRLDFPLTQYELMLRFYEQYGYEGQQCEVREIYKWVRRRHLPKRPAGHEAYAASEAIRVRAELERLRSTILDQGIDTFGTYAITENDVPDQQRSAGRMEFVHSELEPQVSTLELNEVSPVLQWNRGKMMGLVWFAGMNWTNRVYHTISKSLPGPSFDYVTYEKNRDTFRNELESLQLLIEEGASIEALARKHSDSFDWTQANISDTYQSQYGFSFAKEVNSIPQGELKIIQSEAGLHLVQVLSRVTTLLTDEIKEQLEQQYRDDLADQKERYMFIKRRFYETDPYFK